MRILIIVLLSSIIFIQCNNSEAQKNKLSQEENNTSNNDGNSSNEKKYNWQKLEMFELKNNKGTVDALIPLPATWKLNTEGATMIGPNGIRVTDFPGKSFMINYDPSLQYAYSQSPQREMPGIDRLIEEDIIPEVSKKGWQYIRHYEIPEISKMDKWYSDQLYKAVPSKTDVRVYGTEWKKDNGDKAFIILHLNVSNTQQMQTWYYFYSMLVADADAFELAKKQLVFGLSNMRYNLEPIMAYNREEAARVGQSWETFNRKMKANQAAFEASQIAHVNKSNAINDAIMSGWKAQNAASDKNQEQFIDNIYENQKVRNTETGQTYKVQQGYNQYWMNNDGEYIGTKSNTYNPNLDDNMNDKKWEELKEVR